MCGYYMLLIESDVILYGHGELETELFMFCPKYHNEFCMGFTVSFFFVGGGGGVMAI